MWKSNVSIHLSACLLPSTGEKRSVRFSLNLVCQFSIKIRRESISSAKKFSDSPNLIKSVD
jgi:hypothetical protein